MTGKKAPSSEGGKLTPKQEAFAQAYIETGNASEAYRRAYSAGQMKPETIAVEASKLLSSPKVSIRVIELQDQALKRHEVTVDSLIRELEEARVMASTGERPQASAMVAATMGKAKILGMDKQILDLKSSDGSMSQRAGLDISKLSAAAMAEILAAKDAAER